MAVLVVSTLALTGCFGGGGWSNVGSIDGFVYYHTDAKGSSGAREGKAEILVTRSRIIPGGYEPLEGAKVTATGSGGTYITYSREDGYFVLSSVSPGFYEVVVSHDRFIMGAKFTGVRVTAGQTTHLGDAPLGSFFYLIIGIDNYAPFDEYPAPKQDLLYCVDDANALKDSLWNTNGYAGEVVLLTDAEATEDAIHAAIQSIGAKMDPQDYFVMTFSGHGGYQPDGDPDPPGDDPQEYLVAADGQVIDDDEITQWIDDFIPTDYCLFIFDSCHGGGMAKGNDATQSPSWMRGQRSALTGLARDLNQYGYVVITACADTEVSYEDSDLGHGVFTYYFYTGIDTRDADANHDDLITALEAYEYVWPRAKSFVYANYEGAEQNPQLYEGAPGRANMPIYRVP